MSTSTPIRDGSFRLSCDEKSSEILEGVSEASAVRVAQDLMSDGFTGVQLHVTEDSRWFEVEV
jgi:hypothetical protein